jgi:hypothetical protein
MRGGHQKDAGELNLTDRRLGDFYLVVFSKVWSLFAIYDFLARRVRPILIFLRVVEFFKYPLALGIDRRADLFFRCSLWNANGDHAVA